MRRALPAIFSLLLALGALPAATLLAQDGLDAEARATLDTARRAIDGFFALDTFAIEHSQTLDQQIGISLGAESVTIDQRIEQRGTTVTERQPAAGSTTRRARWSRSSPRQSRAAGKNSRSRWRRGSI
ncbi:MAG: hypothetical protein M5T61_09010 [Acidimicrobiia bacterium]|nr:hypothetical protein [Acidimicrobiia bacterium]